MKTIALILVAVIALLAVYAALKSSEYEIAREISIQAAPAQIFPFINNTKAMDLWMPWADIDPKMQMSHQGPESGVGSKGSWVSPGRMGVGSSTIIQSVADQSAQYDLEYQKPFKMHQTAEISIRAFGGGSVVRWSVTGHNPFFCRVMGLFMNMDKMVGGSFDQGLAKLKTIVEARQMKS